MIWIIKLLWTGAFSRDPGWMWKFDMIIKGRFMGVPNPTFGTREDRFAAASAVNPSVAQSRKRSCLELWSMLRYCLYMIDLLLSPSFAEPQPATLSASTSPHHRASLTRIIRILHYDQLVAISVICSARVVYVGVSSGICSRREFCVERVFFKSLVGDMFTTMPFWIDSNTQRGWRKGRAHLLTELFP